ncbi:hypothetical protein ACFQ1S_00770 [Kibdelosporangium lantanae]|uniref:Cell wall-active antibiotics response LiaF-like C-terminal domain-containing protein n=1 Tax=Kibdelosporangium lantanae TaxID=1497396 RepID=A0ABW3M5G4_9PSEU
MPRWGTLLALLAISTGSVLVAAGPPGLAHLGTLLWDNAGWLLLSLGGLSLLATVAPKGSLLGPLVLVVLGLVVLGWPRPEIWALTGGVMAVGGAFLLVKQPITATNDPVVRRSAVLFPRSFTLSALGLGPSRLYLRTVGTRLVADATWMAPPPKDVLELVVSCWGGRVELKLPMHWTVVAGRLSATKLISFEGTLDSPKPIPHPTTVSKSDRDDLIRARVERYGTPGDSAALVVVHVLGFGGVVEVTR